MSTYRKLIWIDGRRAGAHLTVGRRRFFCPWRCRQCISCDKRRAGAKLHVNQARRSKLHVHFARQASSESETMVGSNRTTFCPNLDFLEKRSTKQLATRKHRFVTKMFGPDDNTRWHNLICAKRCGELENIDVSQKCLAPMTTLSKARLSIWKTHLDRQAPSESAGRHRARART
jgi:hypothetical protein